MEYCVNRSSGTRWMQNAAVIFPVPQRGGTATNSTKEAQSRLAPASPQNKIMTILKEIFATKRNIAFERYNFICRERKKTGGLDLDKLAEIERMSG